MSRADLIRRAEEYAANNGAVLGSQLGFGVHGIVFSAEHQPNGPLCAVKVHERATDYARERDVYLRLREYAVEEVRGCHVPQLLNCDDRLWIIEMSVVARPFVLDFAGAYLDFSPDFSEEVLADWQTEKHEQFGARWAEVQAILRELEGYGVYMVDVNPGNVSFGA